MDDVDLLHCHVYILSSSAPIFSHFTFQICKQLSCDHARHLWMCANALSSMLGPLHRRACAFFSATSNNLKIALVRMSLEYMGNLNQTFTISDYNLGEEGDLFKAPEPVIQEPLIGLDPMTAAISMISCGENIIPPDALTVSAIESSIESGQLLSEVYYECKKDILAKDATVTPLSEIMDIKIPTVKTDELPSSDEKMLPEGPFLKSVSSGCLSSMDWIRDAPLRPNFLIPGMDLGEVYGMRRAFSEGDIKTLGSGNISLLPSPMGQSQIIGSCTSEGRKEKLSRYWRKKSKRNFDRKIKYACRKALADSQPRIRGRFAKTEEIDTPKKQ